jgi:shikimate kinase
MNIILIGFRGSGKSCIGKRLANKLWMDFIDTDSLIVERAQMTIREIFEAEGEEGFRKRESEAIAGAVEKDKVVIAAGGGAVLRPENLAALKKNAKVVWLRAPAVILHQRIQNDPQTNSMRPNLAGGGLEEVQQLLNARTPLYEAAADVTLEVANLTEDEAANRLVSLV